MKLSFHRFWMIVLALGLVAAALLAYRERAYYRLPAVEQFWHARHEWLCSSSRYGLLFGVGGLVLMTLNLTYLIRRALLHWRWLGLLRSWMGFHVATGLLAAACILLHSGCSFRSAPATLASLALGIVVLSGLVGRYLYAHVPRSFEGRLMELEEVRTVLEEHTARIRTLGLPDEVLGRLLEPPPPSPPSRSLIASLLQFGRDEVGLRRSFRMLRRALARSRFARKDRRDVRHLLRRAARERLWAARHQELVNLMATWRFLHRWLALLMFATAAVHVGFAVWYAQLRWPWGIS